MKKVILIAVLGIFMFASASTFANSITSISTTPVVQIDDVTYGHVKTNTVSSVLQDFLSGRSKKSKHRTSDKTLWEKAGEIRWDCERGW